MVKYWRLLLTTASLLSASVAQVHAADQDALIKRGEYLAIAGDCGACHTAAGKAPFSGGYAIDSPLGTIYSTNITPSTTAGIGNYTEAQFAAALREGKRGDGSQLYPAMPYTAYAKVSDEDISALYAYFMHGVEPVDEKPQETKLPFPFNLRFSMAAWNLLFLDDEVYTPDSSQSEQWNRGAYLVQGLTHCSTCHTPRNFLMAEKSDQNLEGTSLGTWFAPDITAETLQGTPYWSRDMLANYLATGHASNGATAAGPMLEAIDKSFSRMKHEDLQAIATYLLPEEDSAPATDTHEHHHQALTKVVGDDTPLALANQSEGERLYRNNCASCHNLSGRGLNGLPPLQDHPVLKKPNADNVAMVILEGVWPEEHQGMLGFADEMTDQQIADVTNYVMADIGGSDVQITTERVKTLRAGGETSPLLMLARIGMVAGGIIVVLLLLWLRRRRKA